MGHTFLGKGGASLDSILRENILTYKMNMLKNFKKNIGIIVFSTVIYPETIFYPNLWWWVNHLGELTWNDPKVSMTNISVPSTMDDPLFLSTFTAQNWLLFKNLMWWSKMDNSFRIYRIKLTKITLSGPSIFRKSQICWSVKSSEVRFVS